MEKLREMVKGMNNDNLLHAWETLRASTEIGVMAVNAIVETELESRGVIKLNEDTFEYEIMGI